MSDDEEFFAGRRSPATRITAEEIEQMMATIALLRDHAVELAEHRRHMFKTYLGVGFTEAQALDLCRAFP